MSGNYPPGVTAAHPYFNPPDRSHDHEWVDDELILEDGAAIFYEYCRWVPVIASHRGHRETIDELGEPCGDTKSIAFEAESVVVENGDRYLVPAETKDESIIVDLSMMKIEWSWFEDRGEIVKIDPCRESGMVRYSYEGITVTYRA